MRSGLLGSYANDRNTIVLSRELLSGPNYAKALETLCHECAHAFQAACIEDPTVEKGSAWPWPVTSEVLSSWDLEYIDYVSGSEDFDAYYVQDTERSARAWGKLELDRCQVV